MVQRIADRRAIEEVYWRHRIWPAENPAPKPSLDATLSAAAIESLVTESLRKSEALEVFWQSPITSQQLQAEMDRMSKATHDPAMLRELYAALGNDPLRIAETLARPVLAERWLRHWYAVNEQLHEATRRAAVEGYGRACAGAPLNPPGDATGQLTYVLDPNESSSGNADAPGRVRMAAQEWNQFTRRFRDREPRIVDGSATQIAIACDGVSIDEDSEGFYVTKVKFVSDQEARVTKRVWPKRPFAEWWSEQRVSIATTIPRVDEAMIVRTPVAAGCPRDSWKPVSTLPSGRSGHTAVWTGSEMIIWGGESIDASTNAGWRYDPSTDSWTATSRGANVPAGRRGHLAIWTGTEMIIWGGYVDDGSDVASGGRYDPRTDSWRPTSTGANVPPVCVRCPVVWTGQDMIVWGGADFIAHNFPGARYRPEDDTWMPVASAGSVLAARSSNSAVWTGKEMIVWGGSSAAGRENTGGRYDPKTDSWSATSSVGAPAPRDYHSAVWTGAEMVIWGGNTATGVTATGGRYDPKTNSWLPTSAGSGVPQARQFHSAVWSSTAMIVWGGRSSTGSSLANGSQYDPRLDSWTPVPTGGQAPSAAIGASAIMAGKELIVWGGDGILSEVNTGGQYNPDSNSWTAVSVGSDVPSARFNASTIWTGAEMIVWGGSVFPEHPLNTGGRYDPATDTWRATAPRWPNLQSAMNHTAVWTGLEMIVWGGSPTVSFNHGIRYSPAADEWSSEFYGAGAPDGRADHVAAWTGTEMLVWGGRTWEFGERRNGGLYDPVLGTWRSVATTGSVPFVLGTQVAVWTGRDLLIWGNTFGASGARYDASLDRWMPISAGDDAPLPREMAAAAWTGEEMIVFGGYGIGSLLRDGGRYDPKTDSWKQISILPKSEPPHNVASAVWSGDELIIWGGHDGGNQTDHGARYSLAADAWQPTTMESAPFRREGHSAIWTGIEMIIWGGKVAHYSPHMDGAAYCVADSAGPFPIGSRVPRLQSRSDSPH